MDNKARINLLISKCYALVARRPRTEKEIRDYLAEKKEGFEIIDKVVDHLKSKKVIDDKLFIKWWVGERNYFKPRGIRALKSELQQKGIEREILDDFFAGETINELELAKNELKRLKRRLDHLPYKDKYHKVIGHLSRRGFPYAIAKNAFEDLYKMK